MGHICCAELKKLCWTKQEIDIIVGQLTTSTMEFKGRLRSNIWHNHWIIWGLDIRSHENAIVKNSILNMIPFWYIFENEFQWSEIIICIYAFGTAPNWPFNVIGICSSYEICKSSMQTTLAMASTLLLFYSSFFFGAFTFTTCILLHIKWW